MNNKPHIFEQFMLKKKIDLNLFKQKDINLFNMMQTNYKEMSDKSFDHSNKFLFNELRKKYPMVSDNKSGLPNSSKQYNDI